MSKGKFIVLEGPDGSGTTKHTDLLSVRIRAETGRTVIDTAEPSDGPIGNMIRELLHGDRRPHAETIQLLFCADRAEHVAQVIRPALEKGDIVICDRYALSTILYGGAQGLDINWLTAINAHFPKPDCMIIALPPFETCMERTGKRTKRDQYEQEEFQRGIYDAYASFKYEDAVHIVDTSGEKEDTAEKIWQLVQSSCDLN